MTDNEFKCGMCDKTFDTSIGLKRHKSSAHGGTRISRGFVISDDKMEKDYFEFQNELKIQTIERCIANFRKTKNSFWIDQLIREARGLYTISSREEVSEND